MRPPSFTQCRSYPSQIRGRLCPVEPDQSPVCEHDVLTSHQLSEQPAGPQLHEEANCGSGFIFFDPSEVESINNISYQF